MMLKKKITILGATGSIGKSTINVILKQKKKVFAYNSREYIKDVGTIDRIKQARKDINTNKFKFGNYNKKRPAIFLDKDGVIVKLKKNNHYQNNKNIYNKSFKALSKINNSEYKTLQIEDKIYILFENKQPGDCFEI